MVLNRPGNIPRRIAVALAAVLACSFGVAGATLPDGREETSLAIQNASNTNANVTIQYLDAEGAPLPGADESYVLGPGGAVLVAQADSPSLPDGTESSAAIVTDQPVSGLLVREITANRPTNAHSYSVVTIPTAGAPKVALPILLNNFSSILWNSRIVVVNYGTELACLKLTYFVSATQGNAQVGQEVVDSPAGQAGCTSGYPLPANGTISFGDPQAAQVPFPAAVDRTQLAALIEVTNANGNNDVTASVDIFRSDGSRLLGSYDGFAVRASGPDDVGTDVVMPLAIKSVSGYYSVIGVQNLGASAANVTIRYVGATPEGAPVDVSVALPSVQKVAFHSTFDTTTPIPVGFVGYAVVTSTQPTAAMLVRAKQTSYLSGVNEPIYTAVNGVPRDRQATGWNVPLIYRRYEKASASHIGWNSWIQVQVGDGSSAQVTLRFVGNPGTGCPAGPFTTTTTVSGSKVFYMNADSENGFPAGNAPQCFLGAAQVSSSKPVIVIANVSSDSFPGGDNEALYNAVPVAVSLPPVPAATATPTTVVNAACPDPNATAQITGLDKGAEIVTVAGSGTLTGWYLVSALGNQRFDFPAGFVLNGSVQIRSGTSQFANSANMLWWSSNPLWNNSEDDDAVLYNCLGQQRSFWDD